MEKERSKDGDVLTLMTLMALMALMARTIPSGHGHVPVFGASIFLLVAYPCLKFCR
jgi:hypothetical protein